MKATKLYQTLSQLSVYERNSFTKFLSSPYFNKNEKITAFFSQIDLYIRQENIETTNKEDLWSKSSDEPFSDVKFRKLTSDLLKLLERFIVQQNFESHPYNSALHLVEALAKNKFNHLNNNALNTATRIGNQNLQRSADYYKFNYEINKYQYDLTTEFDKKQKRNTGFIQENIANILHNMDLFYITEKIRYFCTILSWKKMIEFEEEILLIEEIKNIVIEKDLLKHTSIAVYYRIMMTMLHPEQEEHYFKLKEHIQNDIELFNDTEIRDIYDSAVSYCISKVNSGNYKFTSEVLDLYKEALENGALFVDDKMSPTTFRNIVFFAGRAKEYEWATYFVENYSMMLDEKHRENAINFSMARIHFYQQQYEEVVTYLNAVDYEDVWYSLNSKAILISAYYELDEFDALESLLNSFKVYINRNNSIQAKRRTNYNNLIRYTKALIKLLPNDKVKIEKLKVVVTEEKSLTSRPWLLTKINELLAK